MLDAPNRMKHPAIVVAPRRRSIRPVSIPKPSEAIAITAIVVAMVPESVPSSQESAAPIGLAPGGSLSDVHPVPNCIPLLRPLPASLPECQGWIKPRPRGTLKKMRGFSLWRLVELRGSSPSSHNH